MLKGLPKMLLYYTNTLFTLFFSIDLNAYNAMDFKNKYLLQFIFLNNPHAYLPFFTNHITVHLPSLPQGGGSYTKKDPNGPPVDHKGAKFQCGIRADFQKSLLWLPPTGNSLLSPFLFCPLDCHQVFAHCDSTIIP